MGGTLSNIAATTGLAQTLATEDDETESVSGFMRRRKSLDWNQIYDVTLTDLYGHKIQLHAGVICLLSNLSGKEREIVD